MFLKEPDESEGEEQEGKKGRWNGPRNRLSIYEKMTAIWELDRLKESGKTHGLEKAVMSALPHLFMGTRGNFKTGMLGRWVAQCDRQGWRKIPWGNPSQDLRTMKELPDFVRLPMGMTPRGLDRFKHGKQVPAPVTDCLIQVIERITTGSDKSTLTSGVLDTSKVKLEAERLLQKYAETQKRIAEEKGLPDVPCKAKISDRWVNRLLETYGWRRRAPNTNGAYLDYDDERMKKSRDTFSFQRMPG